MLTAVLGLLVAVLSLVLLFVLLLREWPSLRSLWLLSKLPQIPMPPLIGFGPKLLLSKIEDNLGILMSFTKDCGIAAGSLMGILYVFISDPDLLEEVLSSKNHITKGRVYHSLIPWLNTGLLTSTGDKWHQRRKLLTPAFHFKILEDNMPILNGQSKILVERLKKSNGEPIDIHEYITACTLDVIGETTMGIKLKTQENATSEYLKTIHEVCHAISKKEMTFYYLKQWMFDLSPLGRKFAKQIKMLQQFTEQVIKIRKEKFEENKLGESYDLNENEVGQRKKKAFLDILLETEVTNKGSFSFEDLREEVDTFMFEGHDTVSSALMFTLYLLGKHKDIQERVFAEVDEVLGGGDGELTMQDLPKLSYLERVIKETLRLYPSVPVISRKLTSDLKLKNGMLIPEGSNIMIVTTAVHREEKYWPDPDKFDPDRFHEDNLRGRHPFSYIPFSAGPRNCIGQKFALMELKVVLASVVHSFRLDSVPASPKTLPTVVLKPAQTLYASFTPR